MKNTLLFCAICMSIAIAGAEPVAASSILIDFESIGLSEGQSLATEIPGMIFTNAIISEEGSPMTAFQGRNGIGLNDRTRDGENFGGFFITDPIVSGDASFPGTIEIQFNLPVFDLSFMVADIDNYQGTRPDTFTAKAYDNKDTFLETISITVGDQDYRTGDGIATLVAFDTNNISRLELSLVSTKNTAGWGIDNLSYTPVPVLGGIWLLGSGLIGLFGFRKKLRK